MWFLLLVPLLFLVNSNQSDFPGTTGGIPFSFFLKRFLLVGGRLGLCQYSKQVSWPLGASGFCTQNGGSSTSPSSVRGTGVCVMPKHDTWHRAGEGLVPSCPRPGGSSQQCPAHAWPCRIAPVLKLCAVGDFPFSYFAHALEDFDPKLHVLSHY